MVGFGVCCVCLVVGFDACCGEDDEEELVRTEGSGMNIGAWREQKSWCLWTHLLRTSLLLLHLLVQLWYW